jgi:hypothetical protein
MKLKIFSNFYKRCVISAVTVSSLIMLFIFIGIYFFDQHFSYVRITRCDDVCASHIQQLSIAIHAYADVYGVFPPPVTFDEFGMPMHSWRALILPYVSHYPYENQTLKYDYSVPWNHSNNASLHNKMPIVFACPCGYDDIKLCNESSYDMIVNFNKPDHIIKKGSQKCLMLIEVFNTGVIWLKPVSVDIANGIKPFNDPIPSLKPGSKHPIANDNKRYFRCVTDYGRVLKLPTDISPDLLKILAERDEE